MRALLAGPMFKQTAPCLQETHHQMYPSGVRCAVSPAHWNLSGAAVQGEIDEMGMNPGQHRNPDLVPPSEYLDTGNPVLNAGPGQIGDLPRAFAESSAIL